MKNQKSYKSSGTKLYIVPTPIGNLGDITLRALDTLKTVDFIFCEDTRNTKKLINHFEINKPLLPFHEYSDDYQVAKFKSTIKEHDVAYVSDAGMPGISDPAFDLIKICDEMDIDVIILPGASAFVLPLVRSNFSSGTFTFYGFLDAKDSKRKKQLSDIIKKEEVAIIYEAKHRFLKTLKLIAEVEPNIKVTVGRELSKLHEDYKIGNINDVINSYEEAPKGEFVVVIDKYIAKEDKSAETLFSEYMASGMSKKEAIKNIAKKLELPKNEVYQLFIDTEI